MHNAVPIAFVAGGLWAAMGRSVAGFWLIGLLTWFVAFTWRHLAWCAFPALLISGFCGSALWTTHGLLGSKPCVDVRMGPLKIRGRVAWSEEGRFGPRVKLEAMQVLSPKSGPQIPSSLTLFLPASCPKPMRGAELTGWIQIRQSYSPQPTYLPFLQAYQSWRPSLFASVKDPRLIETVYQIPNSTALSEANRQLRDVFMRGQPSEIWRTRLKPFGLGHLLAISGLHCGLFYGFLQLLLFWIRRPWVRLLITSSGLFLFAQWMGWTPSVSRACLMLWAWQFLPFVNRSRQWMRLWWGFLFLILLFEPIHYLSQGVWFSFVASLGVMLGHRALPKSPLIHPLRYKLRWIRPILGAQCMVIPLGWAFGCFASSGSFLWNLMGLVFLAALLLQWLLVMASGLFSFLVGWVNTTDAWLASGLDWLGAFPQSGWVAHSIDPLLLLVVTTFMALALWLGPPEKRWVLALVPVLLWGWLWGPKSGPGLYLLDVGQGQACLLVDEQGEAWLVDGGGRVPSGLDLDRIIRVWGAHSLKGVFISHCNADHYDLIESLAPEVAVYVPENQLAQFRTVPQFQKRRLIPIAQGWHKNVKGGEITIMWPPPHSSNLPSLNETGLALFCDWYGEKVWISGDGGKWAEQHWVREPPPEVDLLIVGHHGSRSASELAFLNWLRPKQAWISCGKKNRFGHPHQETLDHLDQLKIPYSLTSEAHTLSLLLPIQQ